MKCIFKLIGNEVLQEELDNNKTIAEIKELISPNVDIHVDNIKLVSKGRICKDEQTIGELETSDTCIFHIVRCGKAKTSNTQTEEESKKAMPSQATDANIPQNAPSGMPDMFSNFADPNLLPSMMSNPAMMNIMNTLFSNPETLQMLLQNNPLYNQMSQSNPQMLNQMFNPDTLRQMMESDAFRNMANILGGAANQQGGQAGMPNLGNINPDAINRIISSMGSAHVSNNGNNAANVSPTERFASELVQLNEMGFLDQETNLKALERSNGDVDQAIAFLLESNP